MVSVASLVERAGRGGGAAVYGKAVLVYFAVAAAGPPPTAAPQRLLEVLTKCAPIACLVALLALHRDPDPARTKYRKLITVGLALSAVGDALLVWDGTGPLMAGMTAFGVAHVAYVAALGWRPLRACLAVPIYGAALAYTTLALRPPGVLRVLVPAYGALLATMGWRAAARGGLARAGGLAFLVSDGLLGYSMFGGPLPHRTQLVMTSYYAAQLLLALSALPPPPPPPPRPYCAPSTCTEERCTRTHSSS